MTVVEDGLVEMRKKVFQLMRGTEFTAVVFNEVSTCIVNGLVVVVLTKMFGAICTKLQGNRLQLAWSMCSSHMVDVRTKHCSYDTCNEHSLRSRMVSI